MGRPPLPIGSYGKIRTYQTGSGWRAITNFRDYDGRTRPVERAGRTKAAAERELKKVLTQRTATHGGVINPTTRFREVAEQWIGSFDAAVEQGTRSPTSADTYRSVLDRYVVAAFGELRIQETTVPRVDAFLTALQKNTGAATARTARSIVSGVLGLAVRYGALASNPVRETSRIEQDQKRSPRALTLDERTDLLDRLEADKTAASKDVPDLVRFMLATGVRIGESLAVLWPEVDLNEAVVEVNFTVVRVKGKGLVRKSTKTSAGERTLPLPSWAVTMLKQRFADAGDPDGPVFADSQGGWRDPANTRRDFRNARGSEFVWVTSHVFRKTAATVLDDAGLSARMVADQLGHSRPSLTQDVYLGRKAVSRDTADALEDTFAQES